MGMTVSPVTGELKERYKLKDDAGLVVTHVERGSLGQRIGVQPGDVILEVNKMKMTKLSDWDRAMSDKSKALAVLVSRGGATLFISVEM